MFDHIINPAGDDSAVSPSVADAPLRCMVYGPGSAPDGFEALAGEWNALLRRSRVNTIFLTYEWQTVWWEVLGRGELWIVAFRRGNDDELVGIVPLFLELHTEGKWAGRRHFHLVGCIEVSDYLDFIIACGWEAPVYAGLLDWLRSPAAPDWDGMDLCNLPEESITYELLPPLFQEAGYQAQVFDEDTAPQFPLPMRYEQYLQEQVSKKQRHEIRRKQRRAEREADVRFYIVGGPVGDPSEFDDMERFEAEVHDFIALQQASAADKRAFMTPEMQRFFVVMARRMFEAGYLRLCFLTLDGEKAAALFAFEYERQFLLYNSGYDPDSHAQLSPGWVLQAYCIQYAIVAGCRKFDFMQGDEEYKYRFGGCDYRVLRVIVRREMG